MIDLSSVPLSELEALVAKEKDRRKTSALAELCAVAERHGYKLSDLIGATPKPPRKARKGSARDIIFAEIRAGKRAADIAASLGWKSGNGGSGIYQYAAKIGYRPDGKGAFIPVAH